MSDNQKRYFIKASKSFSSDDREPLYIELFNQLNNDQTGYSANINTAEILTNTKKRLHQNLLRRLSDYYHNSTNEHIVLNHLYYVPILFELNLPEQAAEMLYAGLKLARKYELFGYQLQMLLWEQRLNFILQKPTRTITEIQEEEAVILKKQQQIIRLEQMFRRTKRLKQMHGYATGEMIGQLKAETIDSIHLSNVDECLSYRAKYYYNFIHVLYYWMIMDHVNSYTYSERLLSASNQAIMPADYMDGILEHVTSCYCMGYFDNALTTLKIAQEYMEQRKLNLSPSYQLRMIIYDICYTPTIYTFMGRTKELYQATIYAEECLKSYENSLPAEAKQVIKGNLLTAYIGLGDLKKADQQWDSLFSRKSKILRLDVYDSLYLFRLFNLLQNQVYQVIPSRAISAIKYYKNHKDYGDRFKLHIQIAELLLKTDELESDKERLKILKKIRQHIDTHITEISANNHFQEFFSFYSLWINSLIENRPFAHCAASWYKDFHSITEKYILV